MGDFADVGGPAVAPERLAGAYEDVLGGGFGLKLVQGVGPRIDLSVPPSHIPEEILGRLVAIRRK